MVSCDERGEQMRDSEVATLFNALSKILYNQDQIMKHLGINKFDSDYGYDNDTEQMADECFKTARYYEDD